MRLFKLVVKLGLILPSIVKVGPNVMFHVLGVVFFLCHGMSRHQQHCQGFQVFSSNGSSCLSTSLSTPFPPPMAWAWVLEVDRLTPSIWVFLNPICIYGFLLL
jgi:hypothetical protein